MIFYIPQKNVVTLNILVFLSLRKIIITLFIILYPINCLSDIRTKPFLSRKKSNLSLYLGGRYASDYNSKYYILRLGAKYQNSNSMHEFIFFNKANEGHTTTKSMRKTEEKYDIELSNKIKIINKNYYLNLYNLFEQDKYDNFTSSEKLVFNSDEEGFYNRISSLIGFGKIFSKNFETDINIGWIHSKGEGGGLAINPVLYLKKKITDNLLISSRISRIKQQKIQNDYFNLSLTQKINKNWAISIHNKYKKTQYIYRKMNSRTNIREVRKRSERSLTFNLKYFLNFIN